MKILYIHQYFATRESATGTRSYEFSRLLTEMGHEVTVLTGDSKIEHVTKGTHKRRQTHIIDGIKVKTIKNSYDNRFGKLRRIGSFLSFLIFSSLMKVTNDEYDVILATSTPLTIAIPALILSKKSRTPFVFEVRDLWPEAPRQLGYLNNDLLYKILKKIEKKTYEEAGQLIALSDGMKEGIKASGIKAEKISVIPNSCDLTLFSPTISGTSFREEYNLTNEFVLIHGGSMGVINGLDYLVETARILQENNYSEIKIVLTGEGGKEQELKERARKYGLNNLIFTGTVTKKEMPAYFSGANASMMSVADNPVLEMASPNKFFDSLAAGRPIIVNCKGWMKQLVEENQNGFYVDPKKPQELADLLVKLSDLSNQEIFQMGKRSRYLAETLYDREELAKQLEKVLKDTLIKGSSLMEEKR
ncbi:MULTISPECIES: glycosyltransferase family 4 protein [unclassified Enterococcus]|uniref:glycosyltransferase family 4 protein n=1 Tax=unclassified Enterococcus TaxID=2608891 RepID=UPI001CE1A8CB|nr:MULTISPECIES: glycosyltransferase family 4 protein [unclassified Enterococcus]MCA5014452.1 glycosyltransferase family 4 protein [Enterococcus sp. S23]MCA5017434.1 glycosyltransferase family 4 protein [Enterococcus sp. S22(2020)]